MSAPKLTVEAVENLIGPIQDFTYNCALPRPWWARA